MAQKAIKLLSYFSTGEKILWSASVSVILISFFIFDRQNFLALTSSLIGVTSLIFCAKGNPFGQILMIIFGTLYGIISFGFAYYGEMITYLGMTVPMAVIALVSWIKNPYNGNKSQVKVNRIKSAEIVFMLVLAAVVTLGFYYVLSAFNTANIIPSTISVTTSFIAVYLSFRRSAYFAAAYAANDIVLIVLWVMATRENITYLSVTICFIVFLLNDIYAFINWTKMRKQQMPLTNTN